MQEVEIPRFQDSRHMKEVRCSLRNGHLYPPANNVGTHFSYRLSRPQGHSEAEKIMPVKNSKDTIENRTHDLPACSAVPLSTAQPRASSHINKFFQIEKVLYFKIIPYPKNVKTEDFLTKFLDINSLRLKLIIRYSSLVKFVQRPIEIS